MRSAILRYEVWVWLKSPLFYLLATGFFLFSLISMLGSGGFFDSPNNSASPVQLLNSPYSLSSISFLFAKLLLFVVATVGGFSLYRDYSNNTHAILYTFPIPKSWYLNGKLGSVVFTLLLISLLTIFGIYLGDMAIGVENPKISANPLLAYIVAFGVYLVPTLIVVGVAVFVMVGVSRNIFSGFIVVICFVLFQLILENVFFGQKEWLALLDPFGQHAFHMATQEWDFRIQNSSSLPVNGMVIGNRFLWLFLAFDCYSGFYRTFDFQYESIWQYRKSAQKEKYAATHLKAASDFELGIHLDFSITARIKCFAQLMMYDFRSIAKSWMFIALCFFGGIAVFFIQLRVTNTGEFNLLPQTRLFLGAILSLYTLIIIFGTFLFSGSLIHRARQYKMNLMLDATPVSNWQLILSKIGAISLLQIVQLLLFVLMCVAIQIINGYYNFEWSLYFFHLFVLVLPVLFIWNVTAHFVHSLIPSLFLSLFVLACIWLGAQSLEQIGVQTNILKYASLPALEYSDFSGYGHQLKGYMLLLSYWFVWGLLLAFGLSVIWIRGSSSSVRERFIQARSGMTKPLSFILILLSINFLWLGFKIYEFEDAGRNSIVTGSRSGFTLKDYKEEWKPFDRISQPNITDIILRLDLYPQERNFEAAGVYTLVNTHETAIDTIFIRTGFDEITDLNWTEKARLLKEDCQMKSYLYKLNNSLQPGDSLDLSFTIKNTPNTLFSRNSNVLKNGSFIQQDILPRLGYQFTERELPLTNPVVNRMNYFSRDADYVNIHTTVSTSDDQVAIAPGDLVSEKKEGMRNIYEYRSPSPVKFNFSFHSAIFEVIEDQYDGVTVQLYHAKAHGNNTGLMLEGLKSSLDYNTKRFGPYPYKQIRIIEFPLTEENYSATLKSNNIPVSEVLFNINSKEMDETLNLPFYVIAHELTHEWFGNQVMPADAEGAKMLTESITEYISLRIYEEYFGKAYADKFLSAQYNRYKRGRRMETGEEPPLSKVLSHQEYIAYGKGAIAFFEISKSIGRDTFDSILGDFLLKYRYRSDFYPTTKDFIELLKRSTNNEEHLLIDYWLTQTNIVPEIAGK
jgi:ABC-2 type transport system permease protein